VVLATILGLVVRTETSHKAAHRLARAVTAPAVLQEMILRIRFFQAGMALNNEVLVMVVLVGAVLCLAVLAVEELMLLELLAVVAPVFWLGTEVQREATIQTGYLVRLQAVAVVDVKTQQQEAVVMANAGC
tara:strand:- start:20 stop:412 length:393 start_codon:yes stop_codon:yes gene_type:complete